MKKILTIVLVIAMIACFTACGQTSDDGTSQVANPMTEYKNLAELNEAAGTVLVLPEGMDVSNESFVTITSGDSVIAQYVFTSQEVEYTYRSDCSDFTQDISGVYIDGEPAFDGTVSDLATNSDSENIVGRWANINGQFTLSASLASISEEDFASILESFVEYSNPVPTGERLAKYYQDLAGDYQDKTSQRASMHIDALEDGAKVQVSWASSAFENTTWEMTLSLGEDGLLYYTDCTKVTTVVEENEDETVSIDEVDGSGYFELGENGELYWTGASEESCTSCVFEK